MHKQLRISTEEFRRACIRKIVESLTEEQKEAVEKWKITKPNAKKKIAFTFYLSVYLNKQQNE